MHGLVLAPNLLLIVVNIVLRGGLSVSENFQSVSDI